MEVAGCCKKKESLASRVATSSEDLMTGLAGRRLSPVIGWGGASHQCAGRPMVICYSCRATSQQSETDPRNRRSIDSTAFELKRPLL